MLIPKHVKFRRQHRPTRFGMPKGSNKVISGEYGLQALEPAYITNHQVGAVRITTNRHAKRGGRVWIQTFPDRPLTQRPLGVRIGSDKGPIEKWVINIKPGHIMFETSYPDEAVAVETLKRADAKLSIKTRIVREEDQY